MIKQGAGIIGIGPDNDFHAGEAKRSDALEYVQYASTLSSPVANIVRTRRWKKMDRGDVPQ